MKTTKILFAVAFIAVAVFFSACEKDTVEPTNNGSVNLPSKFKVDVPNSLSLKTTTTKKSAKDGDTIKGNEIYSNLRTFIFIGESGGDLVEAIIKAIGMYGINKPMELSYVSDEDQRNKNLVVTENATYNGKTYSFILSITDALSESEADGGKAMQVFWNTLPIDGIAILKPYNINRKKDAGTPNAIYRIEYSEVADANYDSHMVVEIDGLNMPAANVDPYAISTLKMFVGKKGNRVDVYGNSEHPNAKFFTDDRGFDWAFVASGLESENIGVAEVGLPPITLNESSREVLLGTYSIKNVFTNEVNNWFLETYGVKPDSAGLSGYLVHANAPGFFGSNGFIQSGKSPDLKYDVLVNQIKLLSPINPLSIHELTIDFK